MNLGLDICSLAGSYLDISGLRGRYPALLGIRLPAGRQGFGIKVICIL